MPIGCYSLVPDVIAELERARAARRVSWRPEELATLARLLIADGDGDTATRFLYTLHARSELKPASPLRAKMLYQLFELLSDARDDASCCRGFAPRRPP